MYPLGILCPSVCFEYRIGFEKCSKEYDSNSALVHRKTFGIIIEKAAKKRSPLQPSRKSERSGDQYRRTFDMNLKTHL